MREQGTMTMNMQSSAMTDLLAAQKAVEAASPQTDAPKPRHLFGPVIDFLCLGGSSLLLLPFIFLLPEAELKAPVATAMMLLTNLLNHPHFAHSYQIFYRGYGTKAFSGALGREMQVRYLVAGLVVPVLLAAFLGYGAIAADTQLLGYGANIMALAVGWHYAKQGYGMLMVDAALKRRYLDDRTKKILLVNGYAVWLAAWVGLNLAVREENLWGLAYYSFAVPQPLFYLTSLATCVTTALSVWALAIHWKTRGSLPVTGVVAYGVSLYLWLAFLNVNLLWALVVPALHSLQYLTVVWRYQLNYEKAQLGSADYRKGSVLRAVFGTNPAGHMAAFVLTGALLGFLAFWAIPVLADSIVPYDRQAIAGFLFLFTFWIFINVHHYFLDSVMWRRENPDTRLYLFG